MTRYLIILIFSFYSIAIYSQISRCDFPGKNLLLVPQNKIKQVQLRQEYVEIPMVFHIVYESEDQNISDEKILEQIAILNNDFQGIIQKLEHVSYNDRAKIGKSNIQFKLANTDPSGNETNGITRTLTSVFLIGDKEDTEGNPLVMQTESGGQNAWDSNKYINVWICNRSISIGSTLALEQNASDFEGIIINYEQVGFQNNTQYNLGKTLTHECGHYFGLLHPWGNFTGCDSEGDLVDDTPFQSRPLFNCGTLFECGEELASGNFMDFGSDECLLYFTKGQIDRMYNVILNLRPTMISNINPFIDVFPPVDQILIYSGINHIDIYNNKQIPISNVKLLNFSAQLVRKYNLKSEYYLNIDTHGIPTGLYLLAIQREGESIIRKVIIY